MSFVRFASLFVTMLVFHSHTLPLVADEGDPENLQRASIAFRIGVGQWRPNERFSQLMELFERYKGVTDELSFFHSVTHAPIPLDEVQRRADVLAGRIGTAKKLGYRAGINILATIGHHEENLPNSLSGNYTRMTDINGDICRGSFCPNDENLQSYVRQLYEITAKADADFIWIDDDLRLGGHMPIHLTCFCDNCLGIFEQEIGKPYTRESLKAAFVAGSVAERIELRKAWIQHNRNTMQRLLTLIEQTVHGHRPSMELGFMTGDRFYEGSDHAKWARILAGRDNVTVRWRPGAGFYQDERPAGVAEKSHTLGRQAARLPADLRTIQSEIENFPYQRLQKSAHITVLEAASHIAAGVTGAAFNVLSLNDEPLDEYERLVAKLHQSRPFFDLMVKHLGRRPVVGIRPAWGRDTSATCDLEGGNWYAYYNFLEVEAPRMFELGLPIAYGPKHACVTLLSGDNVYIFSDEQVRRLLATSVYMDASALAILNKRGFRDLTGFDMVRSVPMDCIEQLTDHPLNKQLAGRMRDPRQSFYHLPADILQPLDPEAEILARVVDYTDAEVAPCVMGVFQNRLGGRVCVSGYFPWTYASTLPKSTQMKSVMRWLSKDGLPGYVASYHKINLWIRQPRHGQVALALTNSSFDAAKDVTLLLLTEQQQIRVFDMQCNETSIAAAGSDGPYQKFVIGHIEPWQIRLVVTAP